MSLEHGSQGIETDVRVTRDGVLVVSHNSAVWNTASALIWIITALTVKRSRLFTTGD